MKEPIWLTREIILAIRNEFLVHYGGLAGLRDKKSLSYGTGRLLQGFHYENPNLFDLAAICSHGFFRPHPLLDENHRIGFTAVCTLFGVNASPPQFPGEAVLQKPALAASEIVADGHTSWLQESCTPR